jgi:hypothetical protein
MTDKPGRLEGTHTLSFSPANSLGQSELNDVPARQIVPAKPAGSHEGIKAGDMVVHRGLGTKLQVTAVDDVKHPGKIQIQPNTGGRPKWVSSHLFTAAADA